MLKADGCVPFNSYLDLVGSWGRSQQAMWFERDVHEASSEIGKYGASLTDIHIVFLAVNGISRACEPRGMLVASLLVGRLKAHLPSLHLTGK